MTEVHDRESGVVDRESGEGARGRSAVPPVQDDADGDPLSDVLRTVRLQGALFFVWQVSSPFATPIPAGRRFAPVLLPGSREIISYHVVVEGSCWGGLVGGPPLRLQAGDVLLVPRGDAYVMASSAEGCRRPPLDEASALEFFRLMAGGKLPFVVEEGGGGPARARVVCGFLGCDLVPFNPVVAALPPILRLAPPGRAEGDPLHRLVDYALAEARDPSPGSRCTLIRLSELMFVEVVRRCLPELTASRGGWVAALRDPVVGRCLALLHDRPAHPWTLDALAEAAGCSRSTLAGRFAELLGEPPIRYLTRWRLQLAAGLLEDSTATLEAVARRVGYGSAAALSRAFTRVVGVTPSRWRDDRRTGHAS